MRGLAQIGKQTLFVYATGNFLLNSIPMVEMPRGVGVVSAAVFLGGLIVVTLMGAQRRNKLGLGLPGGLHERIARKRDEVLRRISHASN